MATFLLKVLNPKHVVFEGRVTSVFLPGDTGEFELLAHHVPIVSLLKEGDIVVDWETRIPIKRGMILFYNEECAILVEEQIGMGLPGRSGAAAEAHG